MLLMSTHNICFYGEIRKSISELSTNSSSKSSVQFAQAYLSQYLGKICYGMCAVHFKNSFHIAQLISLSISFLADCMIAFLK